MKLHELQQSFQARVLAAQPGIEAHLAPSDPAELAERVEIYASGYASRLVEALAITYSALQKTVGEDEFEQLLRGFIAATPSQFYSVRQYGGRLAAHIGGSAVSPREYTLAELAAFEWTLADVFDAADESPATAERLMHVPPERWAELRFDFRTSQRRFISTTNAVEWWRAANGVRPPPDDFERCAAVDWVLWRAGLTTRFRSMTPPEAVALDAARRGASFADVCGAVAATTGAGAAPAQAASLLRGWFAEELISGIHAPGMAD